MTAPRLRTVSSPLIDPEASLSLATRVLRPINTDESGPAIVADPSDDGSGSHPSVGVERVLRALLSDTSDFPPTIVLASEPSCSPTLDVISSETEEDEPDVHEMSHAREHSDGVEELLEFLGASGGPATAVGSALQTSSVASGSGVVVTGVCSASVPVSGIYSAASGSGSACGGLATAVGSALQTSSVASGSRVVVTGACSASEPVSGIHSAALGSGSACGIGDPRDDRTSDERLAGWSESLGFALGSTFGFLGSSSRLEDSLGYLNNRVTRPPQMDPDLYLYIRHRSRSPVRHAERGPLLTAGISSGGLGGMFPVGRGFSEALSGQHRHRQSAFRLIGRADLDRAYEHASERVRAVWSSEVAFYIGITENPSRRFGEHLGSNPSWSFMVVLVEADSSRQTADLETRLLKAFGHSLSCTNNSAGGERPSAGSPHYLYMLVAETGLLRRSVP
jgi:hypothetical protein